MKGNIKVIAYIFRSAVATVNPITTAMNMVWRPYLSKYCVDGDCKDGGGGGKVHKLSY